MTSFKDRILERATKKRKAALDDLVIEIAIVFLMIAYVLALTITSLSTQVTTSWQPGVGPILIQAVPIFGGIAILLGIYHRARQS